MPAVVERSEGSLKALVLPSEVEGPEVGEIIPPTEDGPMLTIPYV